MTETIDITPVTNDERVMAYARKHQTKAPWDHMAGQLFALSMLTQELSELDEQYAGDELAWAFVRLVELRHKQAAQEFLSFFGAPGKKSA